MTDASFGEAGDGVRRTEELGEFSTPFGIRTNNRARLLRCGENGPRLHLDKDLAFLLDRELLVVRNVEHDVEKVVAFRLAEDVLARSFDGLLSIAEPPNSAIGVLDGELASNKLHDTRQSLLSVGTHPSPVNDQRCVVGYERRHLLEGFALIVDDIWVASDEIEEERGDVDVVEKTVDERDGLGEFPDEFTLIFCFEIDRSLVEHIHQN